MALTLLWYIFLGALALQTLYYLLIYLRVALPLHSKSGTPSYPPVSILVCARNEEENLKELLPLLYAQDYPEFEVIVVDDRSKDETYNLLLTERDATPSRLKPVFIDTTPDHANGKKWAITLGIKAAKHEWVLLTDADCRPASNQWIREMAKGFSEQNTFVLGYSPYQKKKGLLNQFIRFETLYVALQYLGMARAGNPYMGVGRNLAYRKSFFLEKKGFHDFFGLTGGDDDLFVNRYAKRKHTGIIYGKAAITWSLPEENWSSYYRQKKRHLSVGKLYRASDRLILGGAFLSHSILWLTGLLLLAFPDYALWAGIGWGIRILTQYLVFGLATRRLGHKFDLWLLPFLDFLYLIYYFRIGIPAQFAKSVQWRS